MTAVRRILLIRHAAVDAAAAGKCYGATDLDLSDQGRADSLAQAESLAGEAFTHVYHSGMKRTRVLAEAIAKRRNAFAIADARLRELDFGGWEMRDWEAIQAESPGAMMGLVENPDTFAPPGGETLFALRDRVVAWYESLPDAGNIVVVCHGGPIAALRGTRLEVDVPDWMALIPPIGGAVTLEPSDPAEADVEEVDDAPGRESER